MNLPRANKPTLCAEDWERGALDLIAEGGIRSLAIEPLARRMGITKGSFYWHFSNREALLEQALKGWEEHDFRNLKASLGGTDEPRERLCSFFRYLPSETLTHDVYSALCEAAGDPKVEPVLERVAARRMSYLAIAFEEIGMVPETAMHQARLAYSSYLGFLQLHRQHQAPSPCSKEMEAYMDHVIATLIPA